MPCLRHLILSFLLTSAATAVAHQVPNITVEADFAKNRGFACRINFDPRLVISDQPATLPPVPASWYQDQTEVERAKTHQDALAYLRKNLELRFGSEIMALPALEIVAIDGADNKPVRNDTVEVHLLASGHAVIPGSATSFTMRLSPDARASMILLNRVEGQEEAALRVVFPGETAQDFPLTGVKSLDDLVAKFESRGASGESPAFPWIIRGVIMLLVLIAWLIFRRKWRSPRKLR